MTRTAEEQVEAAIVTYRLDWRVDSAVTDVVRKAMIELMTGKFAEEPLPEIIPPPWPIRTLEVIKWGHTNYVVHCMSRASVDDNWSDFHGPERPTKLEAIEAWNAGMRR